MIDILIRRVAFYLRLSKEDLDKPTNDSISESIKNQELMLREEVEKHPDWKIVGIYCDEDFSGAGVYRPGFEKMIKSCEKGEIDIILCKSQSRFSRDIYKLFTKTIATNKAETLFFQYEIRKKYKWTHPVHEVLTHTKNEPEIKKIANEITLNHYPDSTKSRSSYLPLLELSVKEDPNDDRNMHYLGREYMYYEKWNESIDTLIKHLNLPTAT